MKTYFIGVVRNQFRNKHTAVVVLARDLDYLPTDLYEFLGERIITKKQLKENLNNPTIKKDFLAWLNSVSKVGYTNIVLGQ